MLINPGDWGIDSSGNHPSGALLKAHNIKFVCGYLNLGWKNMPDAVILDMWDHGIGVVDNWELTGVETGGAAQGAAEAAEAVRLVKARAVRLGRPIGPWNVILFSLDTSNNAGAVEYNGAAEKVCRSDGLGYGPYGDGQLVADLHVAGIAMDIIWATNAYKWPGGIAPDAHILQGAPGPNLAGLGSVDGNVAKRQFEAWSGQTVSDLAPVVPNIPAPKPLPVDPPPPSGDDDMPTTLHVRCADASAKLPEALVILDGSGRTVIKADKFGPGAWGNLLTGSKAATVDVDNADEYSAIVG